MKKLILISFLCIYACQLQAQRTVTISGTISNFKSPTSAFLIVAEQLHPLALSDDGRFSVDASIQQTPSFFSLAKVSKRGKIEKQTPLIWFESDEVKVEIDLLSQSVRLQDPLPFQPTSEKIEALSGTQQIDYILRNPGTFSSLYFADQFKEKIPLPDLEQFSQASQRAYGNTVYSKRIEHYVAAKKRKALKKGSKVEDFHLPNEDGQLVPAIDQGDKTTLIALLSSGCSFSIASISLLEQLDELNDGEIELITIWEDPSREVWLNAHQDKKKNISWRNLWDEYGFAAAYLNRTIWPTFYVINEEGELTETIENYSKKTARRLKSLVE